MTFSEKIKKLKKKTNLTNAEAQVVLEYTGWNIEQAQSFLAGYYLEFSKGNTMPVTDYIQLVERKIQENIENRNKNEASYDTIEETSEESKEEPKKEEKDPIRTCKYCQATFIPVGDEDLCPDCEQAMELAELNRKAAEKTLVAKTTATVTLELIANLKANKMSLSAVIMGAALYTLMNDMVNQIPKFKAVFQHVTVPDIVDLNFYPKVEESPLMRTFINMYIEGALKLFDDPKNTDGVFIPLEIAQACLFHRILHWNKRNEQIYYTGAEIIRSTLTSIKNYNEKQKEKETTTNDGKDAGTNTEDNPAS